MRVQMLAHDGFSTNVAESTDVKLPDHEPAIIWPSEWEPVPVGAPMHFWGTLIGGHGSEAEEQDQDLFVWHIGMREVARGADAWIPPLGRGNHKLRLNWRHRQAQMTLTMA